MQNTHQLLKFLYQTGINYSFIDHPRNRLNEDERAIIPHMIKKEVANPLIERHSMAKPIINIMTHSGDHQGDHQSNHPAYECKNLIELRQAMENFSGCPLRDSAHNTVFCDGNPHADVMLIGEAPGADEDEQGKPFVGRCGQLLDKMMAAIGLSREVVYISNIIPWRPPGNRPPSPSEIALCLPFIEQHIYLKKPKFLLLLGAVATKALLRDHTGIMKLRGQWQDYKPPMAKDNDPVIRALPTFHPAFLLRSPGQKVHAWEDLKMLKAAMERDL